MKDSYFVVNPDNGNILPIEFTDVFSYELRGFEVLTSREPFSRLDHEIRKYHELHNRLERFEDEE